jgi:hypothetical protein
MHRVALIFLLVLSTTSCYFMAVPEIYLKKSSNVSMELHKETLGIAAMDISRDGRYLLVGDFGFADLMPASLRVWDLKEGRQVSVTRSLTYAVGTVAISPDGRFAIEGGQGGRALLDEFPSFVVWNVETGKLVEKGFAGSIGEWVVDKVQYSPDGRYFLAADQNCILLYDAKTINVVRTCPPGCKPDTRILTRFMYPMTVATFSPDGKYILSGGSDAVLHLWDVETGTEIRQFHGHTGGLTYGINAIAMTPDGRYALTSSPNDDHVKVWDIEAGVEARRISGFKNWEGEFIGGMSLSPDGRYAFVLAKPTGIWDIRTGECLMELQYVWKGVATATYPVTQYHPDGRHVMMSVCESAIRMYDTKTGEEVAVLIGFEDGEWLAITTEGYYNASENGAQYLSVKVGEALYSVDKFYDVFYRPDIVGAKLRGEDISGLITITMQDAIKSPPPDVEFTSEPETDMSTAKVRYRIKSAGGGIGEVRIFHNGKLIESDGYYREAARAPSDTVNIASMDSKSIYNDMRSVAVKGTIEATPVASREKGDVLEGCKEFDIVNGENEISITAFNGTNTIQGALKTVKFEANVPAGEPHLYILAIGVDEYEDKNISLKYAAKDAAEMANKIAAQSATVYNSENIHRLLLKNGQASKLNIINTITDLARKAKPQDGFILFVAGHGVLLQNQYYMLTHDFDGTVRETNMISSNEIVEASKKIKSLSQLLIFDTCHAGGVDTIVNGLYDARMSVLAKKMGLHIYASASDTQAAMDGYRGNGLFTYTLLDGLNNNRAADEDGDGKVSVAGLGSYSKERTTQLSEENGHAQTPLIINFGKDYPIYQLR